MAEHILQIIKKFNSKAVIFDLDGTMLDNNPYHLRAFKKYLQKIEREISDEEYNSRINGRTNRDVMEYLYQKKLSDEELMPFVEEKEGLYRELYKNDIAPVKGLPELLEILYKNDIPMGIATSGIQPNIDFMFDNIAIRKYFRSVVNSSHIKKGKPDPEIFLKTAGTLHVDASACLVFEDSIVGITSAKAAGMKVIALATTHRKEELAIADMIIDDYTELLD
ncbi:MAG: HAD family phosphatase [Chitinophagaceae bacterium]|nr:HAD family phosphatase [Chitinophagaceae bacterium]